EHRVDEALDRRPFGRNVVRVDIVVEEGGDNHFVVDDATGVLMPGAWRAPVLVGDLEVDHVADKRDVLKAPVGPGVVTPSAHETAQTVLEPDEIEQLLVHADAAPEQGDPGAGHVIDGEVLEER